MVALLLLRGAADHVAEARARDAFGDVAQRAVQRVQSGLVGITRLSAEIAKGQCDLSPFLLRDLVADGGRSVPARLPGTDWVPSAGDLHIGGCRASVLCALLFSQLAERGSHLAHAPAGHLLKALGSFCCLLRAWSLSRRCWGM